MDARRNQVYNALFEWQGGALARLCGDRAVSLDELAAELRARPASVPNPPILLLGDGAALCYEYLSASGIPCRIAPELLRWQSAYGVALAALDAPSIPAIELEPGYLRPSQAEREREHNMQKQ